MRIYRFIFVSLFMVGGRSLFSQASIVHDPINYIQAAASSASLLDSVQKQIEHLELAYKNAEREIKMITTLPAKLYNTTKTFIEDQIERVEDIGQGIESLALTIGDSVVNAEELFKSDEEFDKWFDPDLTPEERREAINEDIERATWFRKLNEKGAVTALLFGKQLDDSIKESKERIEKILDETQGSSSVVSQMQAANLLAVEATSMLHSIAKGMANMSKAITLENYQEEQEEEAPPDKSKKFEECDEGYSIDPITFECFPASTDGPKKAMEEALTGNLEDAGWWQRQKELLERIRSEK